MKISIFGLGYVGCVYLGCLAKDGHDVIGVDNKQKKVNWINEGKATVVEKGVDEIIKEQYERGKILATTDSSKAVINSEISFVCVGTPSLTTGQPDLSRIRETAREIGSALKQKDPFHLVVIKSTVPPGTNEEVGKIIEEASGKKRGEAFSVVSNPEFLREGTAVDDYYKPPMIVIGGDHQPSIRLVSSLFQHLNASIEITDIKVAEMIKYANNAFHALKVVFANEVGNICRTFDIDALKLMSLFCKDKILNISDAYLKPGFPYGGFCLPKDLKGLITLGHDKYINTPLLKAIEESNENQKLAVYNLIEALGKKKICMIGLSFKEGTDDFRKSPYVDLASSLYANGYDIKIFDDNISIDIVGTNQEYINQKIPRLASFLITASKLKEAITEAEVILINHWEFKKGNYLEALRGKIVINLWENFNRLNVNDLYRREGVLEPLSPAEFLEAAEFEYKYNQDEKSLAYIEKGIEVDNEIFVKDNNHILEPKLYELKARLLHSQFNFEAAKVASERFIELDREKKYRININEQILLERLEVNNLPFYGNIKWQFKPGINILLGNNGYGKTHLLGLMIALLYEESRKIRDWIPPTADLDSKAKLYLLSTHKLEEKEINELNTELEMVQLEKEKIEQKLKSIENEGKILEADEITGNKVLKSLIEADREQWQVTLESILEKIDAKQRRILATKDGITGIIGKVPILAIPDSRFVSRSELTISNNESASKDLKKDGATEFLYGGSFAELVKKGLFITAQSNATDFTKEPYLLIERIISELTSNKWEDISFRFVRIDLINSTGDYRIYVRAEGSNEELELQKISQGTFSIVAICLMIYRFLLELRPFSENVLHEKAIVFIDEIDAHLHPSWEQKIIGILRREFPNVQFILTAHSPLIVAGCYEGEVAVLSRKEGAFLLMQSTEDFIGYSTPELYRKVFEIEDKDEQYLFYSSLASKEDEFKRRAEQLEEKKKLKTISHADSMELSDLEKVLYYTGKSKDEMLKKIQKDLDETWSIMLQQKDLFLNKKNS